MWEQSSIVLVPLLILVPTYWYYGAMAMDAIEKTEKLTPTVEETASCFSFSGAGAGSPVAGAGLGDEGVGLGDEGVGDEGVGADGVGSGAGLDPASLAAFLASKSTHVHSSFTPSVHEQPSEHISRHVYPNLSTESLHNLNPCRLM